MTLKTISNKSKTFIYDFSDEETATVASHAILGYMVGTYHAPMVDVRIKNTSQLVLEYEADKDKKLNKIFKKICDNLKDYKTKSKENEQVEKQYKLQRVEQLKQSETFNSLIEKVVAYELELLDYADRLLSDEPLLMDSETAQGTLDLVGDEAVKLLTELDRNQDYQGLSDYF
ncbi:hypothetical protein [Streptococcus sp. sy018]|uniref:hypothetical protein n=1 Tax=Streptococcus sp. sy018 TaxID=2600147 RepID=UPI0011B6F08D|nr:hypothetical protein [Streptococcus sp. sy018]TWS94567.1 hypothetical protein FRX52_03620 [Streptococcus sp. sy018]